MQFMDFRVFESALGSQRRFPPLSGHCNLETNIFHINYTIIFYPFLLNSCISCPDRPGIRETKTPLARVLYSMQGATKFMDFRDFESALGS